ncbi:MAG: septum formation protein Maf, partial [Gammaproteobacteria bacterium]|nr:septum formation protein Maf [Gammaproteobacteria bacterium]
MDYPHASLDSAPEPDSAADGGAEPSQPSRLVLALSSSYRRELLQRLRLDFECVAPDVDERLMALEAASEAVQRLATLKAATVAAHETQALVIGSDQLAVCDGHVLGKPGSREASMAQLALLSGRQVSFLTGLCVWHRPSDRRLASVVPFEVRFRPLSRAEIERYVDADRPYDCAGGFKAEGLGISLFQSMHGEDP